MTVTKLSKFKLCGEVNTTTTGKMLYLVLLDLANKKGEIIIPQRKISEALRISKGTVSRNLRRLRDDGHICIDTRYNTDGGRSANKYVLR